MRPGLRFLGFGIVKSWSLECRVRGLGDLATEWFMPSGKAQGYLRFLFFCFVFFFFWGGGGFSVFRVLRAFRVFRVFFQGI